MNLFELFCKIGVEDNASKAIANISEGLGNGLKTAAGIGTAAVAAITTAATAMTTAFIKGSSELAQYGDNIDKMSQKIGISAQAYQEWDFIMQHSGASVDSLQMGVKTLSQKMEKASEVINETIMADQELENQFLSGTISLDEYNQKYEELYQSAYKDIDAFRQLGYSMNDLMSFTSTEELLSDVISRLQGMEEGTERTALATELLGRAGIELGALLNTSAEDTEAMRQQVHELGGVMSNEAVKAAAAYQDSLQNMQTAFSGVQRGLMSEFLPSMVSVMDGLALIFSGNDSGIAKISEGVNQFTDKLMESIPKIFELGEGILSSLAAAILENLPTLTSTASTAIVTLVSGITSAAPLLAQSAIDIIESLVDGLTGDNLQQIMSSAVSLIETLANGVLLMLPKIIALGLDLIVSLATGIADSLPTLIPTIISVISQIVDTLTNPETLTALLDAGIAILESLVVALVDNLPLLIDAAILLINNLVDFILDPENLKNLLEMAILIIREISEALVSAIPQLTDAAVELILKLIEFITAPENSEMLIAMAVELVAAVAKGLVQAVGSLMSAGVELIGGIITGIKNGAKNFSTLAGDVIKTLLDKFKEKVEKIKEIGSNIVAGIKEGIKKAWNNLTEWFKGLFGDIISIAKKILGIASPSKVFKEIGGFTAEGFGVGFDNAFKSVKKDVEDSLSFDNVSIGISSSVKSKSGVVTNDRQRASVSVIQNIYSEAKTAADLMQEALYEQEKAVFLGV